MHMCIEILISQQTQHSDIIWIIITLRKMHVYAVLHIYADAEHSQEAHA